MELAARACHTGDMSEKIARLRISLLDAEPEIWRVVEVPLTYRR